MKKLSERLLAVAAFSVLLLAACTPEEGTVEPNFPAPVEDWVEPNSSYILHISPNQPWVVSIPSEASDYWAIVDGQQHVLSVRGNAGTDLTVEIICLATEQDLAEHTVEVSMEMGGQTQVIATLGLASMNSLLHIRPAVIAREEGNPDHQYFQTPTTETGFTYDYVQDTLATDETLPMLWNAARNGYVSYIQVESNFSYGTSVESGVRITEIQSPSSSSRYSEYEVFCSAVNLASGANTDHFFTITTDATETYGDIRVTLSLPQFVPVLEVKQAVVTEDGENFQIPEGDDSPYQWVYDSNPLVPADEAEPGTIAMIWRPTAVIEEVDSYILVRSNFSFTPVAGDDWLSISEGTVVEETSDTYETETYYRVYVASTDLDITGGKTTLKINFGGSGDDIYSETFNVSYHDVSDAFYVTTVPSFSFDASGEYIQEEMTSGTSAQTEVTSASAVHVVEFSLDNGNYVEDAEGEAGWINSESRAVSSTGIRETVITVNVSLNDGTARSGIIMAFPQNVWNKLEGQDLSGILFSDTSNGDVVASEYNRYVVANISQNAPDGLVAPYMPEWWESASSSFEMLSSDDPVYDEGYDLDESYLITYTYEDLEVNPTIGSDSEFDINFEHTTVTVLDENFQPFAADMQWIQLREGHDGRYYVEVTPELGLDSGAQNETIHRTGYVIISGAENTVAIKVVYDNGGSGEDGIVLEFNNSLTSWNVGWTLTELHGDDMIPAGIPSCWLLEYNGNSNISPAVFDGLPAGGTWEENTDYPWIIAEDPQGGMCMIEISGAENGAEGYLRCMDASGNYICSIVVRLNIAE
ncbi:MAG TPA: hypothetical protein IAC09_08255 [Candidatus Cryptobacteroides intestinipullorum]|nr:hypothetical protein [Candidatus Cryptobacteroides intestinipullorum]